MQELAAASCEFETAGSLPGHRLLKVSQAYLHEYLGALQERSVLAGPKNTASSAGYNIYYKPVPFLCLTCRLSQQTIRRIVEQSLNATDAPRRAWQA